MNRKFHPLMLSTVDVGEPYALKGKKPKIPKAPDYTALAQKQADMQKDLNRSTVKANRVNETNPFGSINYQQDPNDPDKWTSTTTFSPELQGVFNNQIGAQGQAYDKLQQYLQNIQNSNLIPNGPVNAGQTAQDAIMSRLNPQFQTSEDQLRTRLINQGVRPGSEAWDNEFKNFNYGKNDAYSQAALQGINLDRQARQDAFTEQGLPLNAIQAFINGNSVSQPTFGNYSQQANTTAPDLMGAAQGNYGAKLNSANAQNASNSNFMSGLFSLGGSMLGGPVGGSVGGLLGGLF